MVNGIALGQSSLYNSRYRMPISGYPPIPTASAQPVSAHVQPPQTAAPIQAPPPAQSPLLNKTNMLSRYENDPTAMAVRGRIQQPENPAASAQADQADAPKTSDSEAQSIQEAMEAGECQTCAERKYQDGSDDPGVSFKTAAHIDPDQAASVVRAHEQEHVVRNQAKAEREDRKVVSQSVTLHTAICPECGRAYISGGTTRTVTKADLDAPSAQNDSNVADGSANAA